MKRSLCFQKLLERLQDEMDGGKPVIVEGKNDRNALRALGLHGRILTLSSMSFSELAQAVAERRARGVIILTDLDAYGKSTAAKLRDFFRNEGVVADLRFRRELHRDYGVVFLETLPGIASRLEEEREVISNGKNVYRHSQVSHKGKYKDRRHR
ncbi:MAG: toprim domain-containing protein [Candidatus Diapherotrites archaeon]|nr:toprim domain-containing protein [Candidatus Diapherotrites archaeon]